MKQVFIIGIALLCSFQSISQIDFTKLIIGRNTGVKTFYDGNSTRIFGFAETLSAAIDVPGPTIFVNSGDSVKIDFWNVSQGAPHTIHLHGLDVDQQNDGVPSLSFEVEHMEHGYYFFKAPHPGTYLYHCHVTSSIHVQAGMYGVIIVRPSNGNEFTNWDGGESYDHEFILTTSEIDTVWHNDTILDHEHDSLNPMTEVNVPTTYVPQYFMVNGLSNSLLAGNPYYATPNSKGYCRLTNIGYCGVRYIFPAVLNNRVVSSDGRPLPNEFMRDTLEILPGERYESFIDIGLDSTYSIAVEYFNLNNNELLSVQNVIIKTSGLSIDEILHENISIYPNPISEGYATIEGITVDNYVVFNESGVEATRGSGNHIDISLLERGFYIVRVNNSYNLTVVKL